MISNELINFSSEVSLKPSRRSTDSSPWCNGSEYDHDDLYLCIHREILDFANWIIPNEEERKLIGIILVRLQSAVSMLWTNSKVLFCGPTLSKTNLSNDKIEFTVINVPDEPVEQLLENLSAFLLSQQIFRRSQVVNGVVQGIEKPFSYHVDITLNNYDAILRASREKQIFQKFPAVYPLLLLMKFFIFQCRFDSFSHDIVLNLVLYVVMSAPHHRRIDLGFLCFNFFELFGVNFNYFTMGISNVNGILFSKIERNVINWNNLPSLCVEDIFNHGTYLETNSSEVLTFRSKCYGAFKRLKYESDAMSSCLLAFLSRPDFTMRSRNDKMRQYQVLEGKTIESFSLDPIEEDSDEIVQRNKKAKYFGNDNSKKAGQRDNYRSGHHHHYHNKGKDNDRERNKEHKKSKNKYKSRDHDKKKPYKR